MAQEDRCFFAGVIKESEMMLEWTPEQETGITREAVDLSSCRRVERGQRSTKSGVCVVADARSSAKSSCQTPSAWS